MPRFDDLAATFDSEPRRVAMAAGVADTICRLVPFAPDQTVLDYGAGTGLLSLQILPHVSRLLAVDASAGMLDVLAGKVAAAGLAQLTCLHADLEAAPWSGEPVDAVVSSMTLHHIRNVPLVLERLVGATVPGGWLALADLDAEDGSFHGADVEGVHHQGFAREQLVEWLTAAGCVDVSTHDAYTHTKTCDDGAVRSYGLFVTVGRRAPMG